MSDPITAAIEGAIAASAPAESESAVADTEVVAEETPSDTPAEEPAAEAVAEDGQPAAEPAKDADLASAEPAKPKGKRGPIPYDRHEAVLTKQRRESEAKLAEAQARIEALAKYESEDHQAQIKFLHLLETEPARAVEILRQVDPQRFGKLTWAEQQAAAKEIGKQIVAEVAEKPQPDTILPDGSPGYSAEAAERLVQWQIGQAKQDYESKLKALEDRISPITTEHEARVAFGQAVERQRPILENARKNWKGFSDNEPEIRKALADNPTWDLNEAYRSVVIPKLTADTDRIRAEERKKLLDELNAKGKAGGSLVPGTLPAASAKTSNEPRDLEDVIRESIRSLS